MKKTRGFILVYLLSLLLVQSSFAQGIVKDDFKVNDDTLKTDQETPALDVDDLGNLITVWQDPRNGRTDIYAQRLNLSGELLGVNFLVNNQITGYQKFPSVAFGPSGEFVIVWQDTRGGNRDIYAQKLNSFGDTLDSNLKVNDDLGTKPQIEPEVDFSTKIVVVWEDERLDGGDIFAQLLDPWGQYVDTNFKINDDSNGVIQQRADVASDANGNFVVVWQDKRDGNYDICAQRSDSSGNFLGGNFKTNDDTGTSLQNFPKVASDGVGNLIIVWQDKRNGDEDVYAQIYGWTGEKVRENFRVNDDQGDSYQGHPDVAMDRDGNFVVVWVDKRNGDKDIFAQRYDLNLEQVGGNFRVNSDTGSAEQADPAVATDGSRVYFAWVDARNGDTDIFAKVVEWSWTDVTDIETEDDLSRFLLLQNYPNPFNSSTTITFTVHGKQKTDNLPIQASLRIYNIKGQLVRRVMDEYLETGGYRVIWDGRDDRGNRVASGIYFYRLKTKSYTHTRKMLLLK